MDHGINAEVLNMHTIKPIDKEQLKKSIIKKKLIVTIEEHNVIGGLGSAVSEMISGETMISTLVV